MKPTPSYHITAQKAFDLLKVGHPIIDCKIDGSIKIEVAGSWNKEVLIENCVVEIFSGTTTKFEKSVKLINNHFKNCQFLFSYFVGGLVIENCTFDSYLDFQAGGHNKPENAVAISNNDFFDFVNFFDCWYQGPISIVGNRFHKGTNIGSEKQLLTFDIPPIIIDNSGRINIDGELADNEYYK